MRDVVRSCWMGVVAAVALAGCTDEPPADPGPPGPPDSLGIIRDSFSESAVCGTCHPNHYAEWETSMHAYAMTDPVFLRLQEISGTQVDQFCVKCHSPLGSLLQETPPGFDRASLTPLAADAIHCDVCHRIESFDRGRAIKSLSLDRVMQGPIEDPAPNTFHESRFDSRYIESDICSPCHDILTDDGLLIEMTSTEWDLSAYAAMGLECQACHMPVYSGSAAVGGPVHSRLHRHFFTGVDYPLNDFPGKLNTIAMVDELLKNSISLSVDLPAGIPAGDTARIAVTLLNSRTGHSIPSGSAFERQMWVEVIVTSVGTGDTVFSSGLLDPNLDLRDHHSDYVQAGTIPEDEHLALYRNIPKKDGEEILFFWEADEIELASIPAFQTSVRQYPVVPAGGGDLDVSVRVLFRTFPPYFLRFIDLPELVGELIVFEMETFNGTMSVSG